MYVLLLYPGIYIFALHIQSNEFDLPGLYTRIDQESTN